MYLQITTKCNMHCAHCCYSCGKGGKHGDIYVIQQGIRFAGDWGDESIVIGGGEPTLHPRFFDILRDCLNHFQFVWFATNGSRTARMRRIYDILTGNDWDNFSKDNYDQVIDLDMMDAELAVALSQDPWHNPIDPKIVDLWRNKVARQHHGFEIRNVSHSVIAQGRAKRTGVGWVEDSCVCSDIIIKPTGDLKLCGCLGAPIIGTVFSGFTAEARQVIEYDEDFNGERCYKAISRESKKLLKKS